MQDSSCNLAWIKGGSILDGHLFSYHRFLAQVLCHRHRPVGSQSFHQQGLSVGACMGHTAMESMEQVTYDNPPCLIYPTSFRELQIHDHPAVLVHFMRRRYFTR